MGVFGGILVILTSLGASSVNEYFFEGEYEPSPLVFDHEFEFGEGWHKDWEHLRLFVVS